MRRKFGKEIGKKKAGFTEEYIELERKRERERERERGYIMACGAMSSQTSRVRVMGLSSSSSPAGRRVGRAAGRGAAKSAERKEEWKRQGSRFVKPAAVERRMMRGTMAAVAVSTSSAAAASLEPGTEVKKTSMLVVGPTGTLGRQVVRRALDEGYEVRCMVRPMRTTPADFLTEWGATIVYGDITKPETIAPTLVGIHTVVDCATSRPEESVMDVSRLKTLWSLIVIYVI